MIIELSGDYNLDYQEFIHKHPDLVIRVAQHILFFRKNPRDTRLRTHALRKKLQGKHAFSVSDDIRIIFEWTGKTTARFLAIGPHKRVYGRI